MDYRQTALPALWKNNDLACCAWNEYTVKRLIPTILTSFACLLTPFCGAAGNSAPLQFLTHEFAPMNYTENGEVVGLCTDIVKELQRRTGLTASFTMLPWPRAYKIASSSPNVAIFFIAQTEDRRPLFDWVGPIVNVPAGFYAKTGSTLRLENVADAKKAKMIIVHHESHLEEILIKLGFTNLLSVNSPEDAVRILMLSDDDTLMLLTSAPVHLILKKHGYPDNAIKEIMVARRSQGYLGISKGTPPDVAKRMQKALDDMKRDRTFDKLYQKWLPNEVAPGLVAEAEFDMFH